MVRTLGFFVGILAVGLSRSAAAEVIEVGPADDVESVINGAQPGDEIVLADGMYVLKERFSFDIAGTEAEPIIIRAADGAVPHLHRPNASENIMDIDGASWVEVRGIEFSGGSAGVRIAAADHLTIADCEIHDTNDVALRANDGGVLYEALHIVGNHIHDTNNTGEGMYLGCNDNGCQVANSVIERNYVHHTNNPATITQGDGIELKEGSYGNVIADNVIHDTNYPCILTYSAVGNGPANVVERNVMWNCGDHGIQSSADAVIRNNIILSANQNGIAMQSHQSGAPDGLVVVHNTIVQATNDGISLRDQVGPVTIANNAVYAETGSAIFIRGGDASELTLAGNVGQGGLAGGDGSGYVDGDLVADFIDGHFGGAPPIDVFPAAGGSLVDAGDPAHVVDDDFNTLSRGAMVDAGAYGFDPAGNPGWSIAAEFKEFPKDDGGGETGGEDTGSDETGTPPDDGGTHADGFDTSLDGVDEGQGTGGTTDATTTEPAQDDGNSGGICECRASGSPGAAAWGLMLLVLGVTRRPLRRPR
ncbi:MAG: right-handed parallel beta-helix repeat-containing protein [Myxococcota bacterium]